MVVDILQTNAVVPESEVKTALHASLGLEIILIVDTLNTYFLFPFKIKPRERVPKPQHTVISTIDCYQ